MHQTIIEDSKAQGLIIPCTSPCHTLILPVKKTQVSLGSRSNKSRSQPPYATGTPRKDKAVKPEDPEESLERSNTRRAELKIQKKTYCQPPGWVRKQ